MGFAARSTCGSGALIVNDHVPSQSRFGIRAGGKGWMVYDRERKGPALIRAEVGFAANLTREQAERVHRTLTGANSCSHRATCRASSKA
ncbi:hypothetical protein BSZ21_01770 [Bradyrhizobium canariense]|nr:hypothetical protein BSZ21_01770 [Bradyrhizobium canariense]